MNRIFYITLSVIVSVSAQAQTNTFPASGNVGIGTTSPSANLHISNGSTSPWLAIDKPVNYEGGIQFRRTGTTLFYLFSDNTDL